MDEKLLKNLDKLILRKGYANRSEAIRDMIRDRLVQQEWEEGQEVVGVITLLYNHHARNLDALLNDLQHQHHESILSTTHIHLDEDNCLELLAVRGEAKKIEEIAGKLISLKGVRHGKLTVTSTGKALA